MKCFSYTFVVIYFLASTLNAASDLPKMAAALVQQYKNLDEDYVKAAHGLSQLVVEEKKIAELVNQCKMSRTDVNCVRSIRVKVGALEVGIDEVSASVQLGMMRLSKLGDQLADLNKLQTEFTPTMKKKIEEVRDDNMKRLVQSTLNTAKVSDLGFKAVRHRYSTDQIEYIAKTRNEAAPGVSEPKKPTVQN